MTQTLHTVVVPTRRRLRPWASAGGRLFVAYWGSLALLDLTRGLPAAVAGSALLLLTVVCSRRQPWTVALAVAGVTWLFQDGFVAHSYGALTPLHLRDVAVLVVLVVAAAAAANRTHPRREAVAR